MTDISRITLDKNFDSLYDDSISEIKTNFEDPGRPERPTVHAVRGSPKLTNKALENVFNLYSIMLGYVCKVVQEKFVPEGFFSLDVNKKQLQIILRVNLTYIKHLFPKGHPLIRPIGEGNDISDPNSLTETEMNAYLMDVYGEIQKQNFSVEKAFKELFTTVSDHSNSGRNIPGAAQNVGRSHDSDTHDESHTSNVEGDDVTSIVMEQSQTGGTLPKTKFNTVFHDFEEFNLVQQHLINLYELILRTKNPRERNNYVIRFSCLVYFCYKFAQPRYMDGSKIKIDQTGSYVPVYTFVLFNEKFITLPSIISYHILICSFLMHKIRAVITEMKGYDPDESRNKTTLSITTLYDIALSMNRKMNMLEDLFTGKDSSTLSRFPESMIDEFETRIDCINLHYEPKDYTKDDTARALLTDDNCMNVFNDRDEKPLAGAGK